MNSIAEEYLAESEPKIAAARDYLIAVAAALSGLKSLDEHQTAALFRMVDNALDEIKALDGDFNEAFHATFGQTGETSAI